jgi:hypothetical protein
MAHRESEREREREREGEREREREREIERVRKRERERDRELELDKSDFAVMTINETRNEVLRGRCLLQIQIEWNVVIFS